MPTANLESELGCFVTEVGGQSLRPGRSRSAAISTRSVAAANASNPSLIAPATSGKATGAASGRQGHAHNSYLLFTVVPFLLGHLVVPDPHQAGLRREPTLHFNNFGDIVGRD